MDEMIEHMLKMHGIGALRADDAVARQGVMNFGTSSHFMNLLFVKDSCEVSIAEAYAMQGLAAANLGAQASGYNMAKKAGG